MTDALAALVAYLRSNSALSLAADDRIRGEQLKRADSTTMPAKTVVLKVVGGPALPNSSTLEYTRIDCWSYGETPAAARTLRALAYEALMALKQTTQAVENGLTVLLHSATPVSGPRSMQDPDGQWPVVIETWMLLTDTRAVS